MVEVFEKKGISFKFSGNKYETKICPKMLAYFALKTGWLKINVETNLEPQISMYLSAIGNLITHRNDTARKLVNIVYLLFLMRKYLIELVEQICRFEETIQQTRILTI